MVAYRRRDIIIPYTLVPLTSKADKAIDYKLQFEVLSAQRPPQLLPTDSVCWGIHVANFRHIFYSLERPPTCGPSLAHASTGSHLSKAYYEETWLGLAVIV